MAFCFFFYEFYKSKIIFIELPILLIENHNCKLVGEFYVVSFHGNTYFYVHIFTTSQKN
jgi:hypothetical protein